MGGNQGSGVTGGAYWQTLFGQQFLRNADLIVDRNLFANLPGGAGNAAVRYNTLTRQFTYDVTSSPGNSGLAAANGSYQRIGVGKQDVSKGVMAIYSAQGGLGNGISIENGNAAGYAPIDFWGTELMGQLAVTGSAFTNGMFASNSVGLAGYGNGGMALVATKGPLKFASGVMAKDEVMRITTDRNIGIGTTIPNAKAILDISSTTQGFLPPRMTTKQRTAISSPAEGLCIYDLTLHKLYVYDGTVWQAAW